MFCNKFGVWFSRYFISNLFLHDHRRSTIRHMANNMALNQALNMALNQALNTVRNRALNIIRKQIHHIIRSLAHDMDHNMEMIW